MEILSSCISKKGGRDENQDSYGSTCSHESGLWVVADGLGGHAGGQIASKLSVEEILGSWEESHELTPESLKKIIEQSQDRLLVEQQNNPDLSSMRTTIVLLAIDAPKILWAHVGDSRFYHFRGTDLKFQSKDHSVPQAMVDIGEIELSDIRMHPDRNRILRALGNPDALKPTIQQKIVEAVPGDAFLLCTDGFWEYIEEEEMLADLSKSKDPQHWLELMEVRLLRRVEPSHDNYTAMAVWCD